MKRKMTSIITFWEWVKKLIFIILERVMGKKNNLIAGLDIGSSKVCTLIAHLNEEGGFEIIGYGETPSKGLKNGVVVNIESTVEAIQKAVEDAEVMAGEEIDNVIVAIGGPHIKGQSSHGLVIINDKEVKKKDKQRVIDNATAVAIPRDKEIIHVIPQEYIIDDQGGIKDPVGLAGVRLEAKVHIVTGATTSIQNVVKSCNKAGLEIEEIVLQQLASAEAVLTEDEKELGVALIDIGAGTTDIAIFYNGSIKFSSMFGLGGDHITNDIAVGFHISKKEAENMKIKHGCACSELVKSDEMVKVERLGGNENVPVSKKILSEIIEPRVMEILSIAKQEIKKSGVGELIASGIVLTGGTTLLEGIDKIARQVFPVPVRLASPGDVGSGIVEKVKNPAYATVVGLCLYGTKMDRNYAVSSSSFMKNVINWIQEFV
ncbi:MAG: cell division protein FtsA [Candidatus Schekmanbacteria bacterium]|nr:MAG: cell division protein FtsA [Candidatus Schekmanbacteria bacterium]